MDSLFFLILLLFWIPVWLVRKELAFRDSPQYWQRWGAVVLRSQALQGWDEPIGTYMGVPIFQRIRFHDCDYEFDRVLPSDARDFIGGGELFLEPGLVYRLRPVRSGKEASAAAVP